MATKWKDIQAIRESDRREITLITWLNRLQRGGHSEGTCQLLYGLMENYFALKTMNNSYADKLLSEIEAMMSPFVPPSGDN